MASDQFQRLYSKLNNLDKKDLHALHDLSILTLDTLVTEQGIYASSNKGNEGLYYAFFGRDTAITFAFILETYLLLKNDNRVTPKDQELFNRALKGFLNLSRYQGVLDDPETGQERGKAIHECRFQDYDHLTHKRIEKGEKPWFVDQDGVLKNWDTADATALRIFLVGKLFENAGKLGLDSTFIGNEMTYLLDSLEWCLKNINQNKGFAGFSFNPQRKYDGLRNQNWKDSEFSMRHHDGSIPASPIKPVEVNAFTWAALMYGADITKNIDRDLSNKLKTEAEALRERFNSEDGFLMKDRGLYYFAEAIDGKGKKIETITCDPGFVLWASFKGESIAYPKYLNDLVERLTSQDMYDEQAGIRTYSREAKTFDPIGYHAGPNTFWPFTNGLISLGLESFGYKKESEMILRSTLKRIRDFNSCIELFLKNEDKYERYKDPITGQLSCSDQAWTAGTVYYGVNRLLNIADNDY